MKLKRIKTSFGSNEHIGILIAQNDNFLLLNRVHDLEAREMVVIPMGHVTSITDVIRGSPLWLAWTKKLIKPTSTETRLAVTWRDELGQLVRHRTLLVFHLTRDPDDACYIGTPVHYGRSALQLRTLAPSGEWDDVLMKIRFDHIAYVQHSGCYEATLEKLLVPLPDAGINLRKGSGSLQKQVKFPILISDK